MPRLGKKTLYLDLDAMEELEAALSRFPGRPSISSFLSEQLPQMAKHMTTLADAMETGGLRGLAQMYGILGEVGKQMEAMEEDVKETLRTAKNPDKPLSELVADVPPKKPRKPRAKKVDKA